MPSSANMLLQLFKVLFSFGVQRGYRRDNPAAAVKRLKTGKGHRPWSTQEIQRFQDRASPELVLAMHVGLWTGQRKGDCLKMTWRDFDGSGINVVQQKTDAKLWLPCHSAFREILGSVPRQATTILTRDGRPWTYSTFDWSWRQAIKKHGAPGLTFHGLRYTAAGNLAESGCDPLQVASITGHKSLAMVQKYTSAADQKRLALAAIEKLERHTKRT